VQNKDLPPGAVSNHATRVVMAFLAGATTDRDAARMTGINLAVVHAARIEAQAHGLMTSTPFRQGTIRTLVSSCRT
jgi:hypothetical protein